MAREEVEVDKKKKKKKKNWPELIILIEQVLKF